MSENAKPMLGKLNTNFRTNDSGDVLEVPSIAIIAASPVQSDTTHHFDHFDSIGRVINSTPTADEEETARTTKMKARILDNIFTQLSESTTSSSTPEPPGTAPSTAKIISATSSIPPDVPSTAPVTNSFFFTNPLSSLSSSLNQLIPKSIPVISLPTLPSLPSFSSLLSNRPKEADAFVVGTAPGAGVGEIDPPDSPRARRRSSAAREPMLKGESSLDMDLKIEDAANSGETFVDIDDPNEPTSPTSRQGSPTSHTFHIPFSAIKRTTTSDTEAPTLQRAKTRKEVKIVEGSVVEVDVFVIPERARRVGTVERLTESPTEEEEEDIGQLPSFVSQTDSRSTPATSPATSVAPSVDTKPVDVKTRSRRSTILNKIGIGNSKKAIEKKKSFDALRERATSDPVSKKDRTKYVKVKTKGKSTKELSHLFLAQELVLPPIVVPSSSPPATNTLNPHDHSRSSTDHGADRASIHSASSKDFDKKEKRRSKREKEEENARPKNSTWVAKWSLDGRYLATGGKDGIVRVWEVLSNPEDRASTEAGSSSAPSSPPGSPKPRRSSSVYRGVSDYDGEKKGPSMPVFNSKPLHEFTGHTSDILDLSWSKNNFLLSASMDKTVRLFHTSRPACLCAFKHCDFVTAVAFHPNDDRFFLSSSLDAKLRLWSIPDKRVHLYVEVHELLTTCAFTSDGKLAIGGTFNGQCLLFEIENFRFHSLLSTVATTTKKGQKITSIVAFPSPSTNDSSITANERLLITSNDSTIRLYTLVDKRIETVYSGHLNETSQIRGGFGSDGEKICCGSEDGMAFIWDSGLMTCRNMNAQRRRADVAALQVATNAVEKAGKKRSGWGAFGKKKSQSLPVERGVVSPVAGGGSESFVASTGVTTCVAMAPTRRVAKILAHSNDPIFASPAPTFTGAGSKLLARPIAELTLSESRETVSSSDCSDDGSQELNLVNTLSSSVPRHSHQRFATSQYPPSTIDAGKKRSDRIDNLDNSIIIVADDISGLISVYRNSPIV